MNRKAGAPHKGWKGAARKAHERTSVAGDVGNKVRQERIQCIRDMRRLEQTAQSLGLYLAAHLLRQAIATCDWVGAPPE